MREPITGQAVSQDGVKVDGKLQGEGRETYHDGSSYEGTFVNGAKQGQGKYVWADGAYYEGSFEQDKMQS